MYRFGGGRKKSPSINLYFFCYKCNIFMTTNQRSYTRHSHSCTGGRGSNKKQFGAIHQHDASLLPRDPSIYSSSLSPIVASSEKSNIEDLSSILNSSFLNEIVNALKEEGVAAVDSDIYEGIDSRAGSRPSLRTGAGASRHDGGSDRSCNTRGSDATFDIQEGVGINNGGDPIEQLMHLFGSQFVDDWMGDF